MKELIINSSYFGLVLSLGVYLIVYFLKKKIKSPLFNPLIISVTLIIGILLLLNIDYDTYNESAQYLNYMLTPLTVCLAVPLYENMPLLKENPIAIISGIVAGIIASGLSILAMSVIFGLTHAEYVTMLPKSVTMVIGMGVADELGGIASLTATAIAITGNLGNLIAPLVFRLFKIKDPIARGVACGTSAHSMGTAKAFEFGQIEGAMSSLSIAVAGILTVFAAWGMSFLY